MIRLVTRARLEHLTGEAHSARAQAREVGAQADAAYGEHLRAVFALTTRIEAAEKDAETVGREAARVQLAWEDKAAELAEARKELADAQARIEALSAPPHNAVPVLLLHYGEPHSIHVDQPAAQAYADTLGAPLNGWGPASGRPASAVEWRCIPFIYEPGGDLFRSVTAPAVKAVGGAG